MKFIKFLDEKGEEIFLVVIIAFSVVLLFMQVIMRYVFKNSLSWSEELARYLFLWMIWVGASLAAKNSKHLRAEFLEKLLPKKVMRYIFLISMVLWFAFSLWLAQSSFFLTRNIYLSGQKSSAMQIPMYIPYASVPVGSFLMSVRVLQNIILFLKQKKTEG